MAGLEPARAFTAQRILSPLRLPFRHIGVSIWIADAHRKNGKRFVVTTDENLTAFLELSCLGAVSRHTRNWFGFQ